MMCKNCPVLCKVKGVNDSYICAAKNEYLPYAGYCRIKATELAKAANKLDAFITAFNKIEKEKNGKYAFEIERVKNEKAK